MSETKNSLLKYGFKPDIIEIGKDYVFGGFSLIPEIELQPNGDWTSFLPYKEVQNLNGIEPYACVSFTILNCAEILIKRQYGEERNYSDRFLASISGTKEGGNQPNVVCEFLRKVGVVTQDLYPFDQTITSFEKFYDKVPPKLYELAREFNNEWDFKHDTVPNNPELIRKALKSSPLGVSVPAWYNIGEKYYRPKGVEDNHFTTLIKQNTVFDSYDSIIKELDTNMGHSSIKRFYIKKRVQTIMSFMEKLKVWYNSLTK